jgi:hypothetical protein
MSPMPTLTYDYVYFASGPHQRQPRLSSGPGGFTLIQSIPGGTLSATDSIGSGIAPSTLNVGGAIYNFAFVNISGGTPPGATSLVSTEQAGPVAVSNSNIVVLYVYLPPAGIGNGDYGATIDSFDEDTGNLFDDTFVTVAPDPTGALTTSGNVEGWVDTTANTETITALSPTSPTGVDFDQWVVLGIGDASPPTGVTISSSNLTVAQSTSVSALAFYKAPPTPPPPNECQEFLANLNFLIQEKKVLVSKVAGDKLQLAQCLQQGQITQAQYNATIAALDALGRSGGEPPPPGRKF